LRHLSKRDKVRYKAPFVRHHALSSGYRIIRRIYNNNEESPWYSCDGLRSFRQAIREGARIVNVV